MTRRVEGVLWAEQGGRPGVGPSGPKKGLKAAGLRYEAEVAGALPPGLPGLWWHFQDANGLGWCQTDLLLRGAARDLIIEVKLTYTEEAWVQLEGLYLPVVATALGRPVLGIQICKRFLAKPPAGVAVATEFAEAVKLAAREPRVVLHWLGRAFAPPLWPLKRAA